MLTPQKILAMKRIKEEFDDLKANPLSNIGATVGLVNEDNIFEWNCSLMGPVETSYEGGLFFLKIKFPENYPEKEPEIVFKTPIYHININPFLPRYDSKESLGHVCISTLNWWKPENRIRDALKEIFTLFYLGNPRSPYGLNRADEMEYNRPIYEGKIKYFTKKYADPSISKGKEWDKDWDFSFP